MDAICICGQITFTLFGDDVIPRNEDGSNSHLRIVRDERVAFLALI
ncbi:hypothetical protein RBSWK_06101 [Rhodopirellula baltica SWK14]|uniref:Uncharacterized protein n=1 Tax=Rhodopirellula baltica SWK14 TaxID=993516 RepID=L7C7N2_RHOBT|nr:hypothetical protein RBSWK_06101 [Rhodopirellula baltica SWK14]